MRGRSAALARLSAGRGCDFGRVSGVWAPADRGSALGGARLHCATVKLPRPLSFRAAFALAALGFTVLYLGALLTGFLNDDYLFREDARRRALLETLFQPGPLGNFFRPLSRQVYFAVVGALGGAAWTYHLVNYALFLVALMLLADLLRAFVRPAGALAGVVWFALLPLQRVNLTWISCAQDLIALVGTLGALALWRRGRILPAALAYFAALLGKESALPLPFVLAWWDWKVEPRPVRERIRRLVPFVLVALPWALGEALLRVGTLGAPTRLSLDPGAFAAGYVHLVQSLLGLEYPAGFLGGLLDAGSWRHVGLAALALIPLLALAWGRPDDSGGSADATAPVAAEVQRPGVWGFAVAWLIAFGFVTGPVSYMWSAYYYTLAAAGGALIVARLARHLGRAGWIAFVVALMWLHAGSSGTRAFATNEGAWKWTSSFTAHYFERAAALSATIGERLRTLEPRPPHGTRFFFATLPPWAGFQMGNGAAVRSLYHDDSLESWFYSQFSESTAAAGPYRFLFWNGVDLEPLYAKSKEPLFEVGSDLLLLERPTGARYAFRRGLQNGEGRMDNLYWLGWAYLYSGDRTLAEQSWRTFGAHDDSLLWIAHLRAAHNAHTDGDSLDARRHLVKAIEFGIGRPEAHAVLGQLMMPVRPKYGMLELQAAVWLDPKDWLARRELFAGLVAARLDESARHVFDGLQAIHPDWRADSTLAPAIRALDRRTVPSLRAAKP